MKSLKINKRPRLVLCTREYLLSTCDYLRLEELFIFDASMESV